MKTQPCFSIIIRKSLPFVFFVLSLPSIATIRNRSETEYPESSGITFIENRGQLTNDDGEPLDNVYFYAESGNLRIYLTNEGLSYFFLRPVDDSSGWFEWERMDMQLESALISKAGITSENAVDGFLNYYMPHCSEGITEVRAFQKITVKNIYPGIDWVLSSSPEKTNGQFKQDFIVHPGAKISSVLLHYIGTETLMSEIRNDELHVQGFLGELNENGLVGLNRDHPVGMHYIPKGNNTYGFESNEAYDTSFDFIIDPNVLVWGTYYGGSLLDAAKSICSDGTNVWVAGTTTSVNLPCLNANGGAYYQGVLSAGQDLLLLKFASATSIRISATYYGGNGSDVAGAIHSDGTSVFVTGSTSSTNFPVQNAGGGAYYQSALSGTQDMFLLKFNTAGVRQWGTLYGGNGIDGGTSLMSNGTNLFVCGYSRSSNFPVQNGGAGTYNQTTLGGVQNAVVLKFTTAGVRNWSTYYGGDDTDVANSITVNGANMYVVGQATSSNFPVQNPGGGAFFQGAQVDGPECFIIRFNTTGARFWSTYYGGNDDEGFNAVHCDGTNVWVTGYAVSDDFPVYNPGGGAYFQGTQGADESGTVLKFSLTGVRLWATFYGGNVNTEGNSIFSSGSSIWITGRTESDDFPTQDPGNGAFYQPHNSNLPNIISESWDMFILEFDPAGVRQWATYYGKEEDDLGSSVWFDGTFLFFSGTAVSGDLYLVDPGAGAYFQSTCGGCGLNNDGVILKFGVAVFTPVELVDFRATAKQENILLEWETASEINNDYFEVQHSTDGMNWDKIGMVEGSGTCQLHRSYSMIHDQPHFGFNYYRLKQVDFNGESEYSPTVSVWFRIQQALIYPNPTRGILYLNDVGVSSFRITMVDASGKIVLDQHYVDAEQLRLDVSFLPEGMYSIQITTENFIQHFIVMKQY